MDGQVEARRRRCVVAGVRGIAGDERRGQREGATAGGGTDRDARAVHGIGRGGAEGGNRAGRAGGFQTQCARHGDHRRGRVANGDVEAGVGDIAGRESSPDRRVVRRAGDDAGVLPGRRRGEREGAARRRRASQQVWRRIVDGVLRIDAVTDCLAASGVGFGGDGGRHADHGRRDVDNLHHAGRQIPQAGAVGRLQLELDEAVLAGGQRGRIELDGAAGFTADRNRRRALQLRPQIGERATIGIVRGAAIEHDVAVFVDLCRAGELGERRQVVGDIDHHVGGAGQSPGGAVAHQQLELQGVIGTRGGGDEGGRRGCRICQRHRRPGGAAPGVEQRVAVGIVGAGAGEGNRVAFIDDRGGGLGEGHRRPVDVDDADGAGVRGLTAATGHREPEGERGAGAGHIGRQERRILRIAGVERDRRPANLRPYRGRAVGRQGLVDAERHQHPRITGAGVVFEDVGLAFRVDVEGARIAGCERRRCHRRRCKQHDKKPDAARGRDLERIHEAPCG